MALMTLLGSNIMPLEYLSTCCTGNMVLFYFSSYNLMLTFGDPPFLSACKHAHTRLSILLTFQHENKHILTSPLFPNQKTKVTKEK